jgi:hypothetical protein
MANTALGRTEQALLTNKSGGALVQGDVVIVDTANAAAVTTTTTSAYVSGRVGVVLEPNGIANNATGMIAFSGYVPIINLSATGNIGDSVKTHTVAKQGVRHAAPQVAGDFAQVLGTTATPAALLFGTVQLGSGTGLGYSEGTSFPGSPSTNDKYYRTDRNLLYYYDGTRWLTTEVFCIELKREEVALAWPASATGSPYHRATLPFGSDYDYYLLDWHWGSFVLTTNNGTNYWTANLHKFDTAAGDVTVVGPTTAADTAGTTYAKKTAINALMGAYIGFYTEAVKTLSPGTFRFYGGHVTCRAVG